MYENKLLVVVDVQNDFVSGALGTSEAQAIIPNIVKKIRDWDGAIISTLDTHDDNYLNTNEGKHLPVPHCINGTSGWDQNAEVADAIRAKQEVSQFPETAVWTVGKDTFASTTLPTVVCDGRYGYIELIGLCTDICVVSNALFLKAHYPELTIAVDPTCCAGVTPESHKAALTTMKMCQIEIVGS